MVNTSTYTLTLVKVGFNEQISVSSLNDSRILDVYTISHFFMMFKIRLCLAPNESSNTLTHINPYPANVEYMVI